MKHLSEEQLKQVRDLADKPIEGLQRACYYFYELEGHGTVLTPEQKDIWTRCSEGLKSLNQVLALLDAPDAEETHHIGDTTELMPADTKEGCKHGWRPMDEAEPMMELICLRDDGEVVNDTLWNKPTGATYGNLVGWMPMPADHGKQRGE